MLLLFLRFLVVLCIVLQAINHNWNNVFYCGVALILFTLPYFIEKNFKIDIPNSLEIIAMIFIFASMILGEVNRFYLTIPHFDTLLHTINGFICCAVGFSLVELLNDNIDEFKLTPIFRVIVAFCFSMTIGIAWEFFEYGCDVSFNSDMQKDTVLKSISSVDLNEKKLNEAVIIDDIKSTTIEYKDGNSLVIDGGYLDIGLYDTMKDLIVNFIGAIIFSIIGLFYLNNKEKYKFTEQLFIKKTTSLSR